MNERAFPASRILSDGDPASIRILDLIASFREFILSSFFLSSFSDNARSSSHGIFGLYTLIAPSYINVLNVYAVHPLSSLSNLPN